MSAISLKSITGITSITTPAGVDNVFTVHTNDTTERFRVDQTGNLNIAGIITATSFSGSGDLTLTSTDTGSSASPIINLFRNSASPADADYIGQIKFQGESDTGTQRNYAKITGKILDASNGTEDGIIEFAHIKAGSQTITGRWRSDSLQLLNGTALTVAGSTTVTGNIIPSSDSATDIGTNSVRFANIYGDTLYGDGSNLTGISAGAGGNTGLDLNDSVKIRLGTGNDLEIFHDSNNSIINDGGTGDLKFQVGGSTKFQTYTASGEAGGLKLDGTILRFEGISQSSDQPNVNTGNPSMMWVFDEELNIAGYGKISFVEQGFKRWTINGGALHPHSTTYNNLGNSSNRVGNLYIQTSVDLIDSAELRLGNDDDLKLFHNGSSSVIRDGGSGALTIQNAASEVNMYNTTDNEYLAQFINGGACKLYYDGSRKFDTLTNGIQITGQQFISEGTITLEKSGVHHHRILSNDTGNDLAFQQSADNGSNTNFTTYLRINNGGNISLPVDNQRLRLGAGADLQLYHDATFNQIESHNDKEIHINAFTGGAAENMAKFKPNGVVELFHNASKKFSTQSFGADIYGQLQIAGHCTPSANNAYDLGTTSERWRNLYVNDLQLSNISKKDTGGNDVDGTWGDWTLQEGESDVYMLNNRSGKKFRIKMEEVE